MESLPYLVRMILYKSDWMICKHNMYIKKKGEFAFIVISHYQHTKKCKKWRDSHRFIKVLQIASYVLSANLHKNGENISKRNDFIPKEPAIKMIMQQEGNPSMFLLQRPIKIGRLQDGLTLKWHHRLRTISMPSYHQKRTSSRYIHQNYSKCCHWNLQKTNSNICHTLSLKKN